MDAGASAGYLRDMHTLFDAGTASGLSDRQLLERFAGGQDSSAEAAFEVLVLRHGPMVMRVCQVPWGKNRPMFTTRSRQRSSSWFERANRSVGWTRSEAGSSAWPAGWRAAHALKQLVVDRPSGKAACESLRPQITATIPPSDRISATLFQAEVERLPDHLRAVVVLCYWEGLTHEQAAMRLGCPLGTVRSRVARARNLLHRRLSRRGLEPVAGVMAAAFDSPAFLKATALEIPATLVSSTVQLAKQVASGGSLAQLTSPSIAALVQKVIGSMFMTKLKNDCCRALLLIGAGAYGLALAAPQIEGVQRGRRDRCAASPPAKLKAQPPLELMSEYVVEPPDLLLVEVLEALPGTSDLRRASGAAGRQDLTRILWRHLRRGTDSCPDQRKDHPSSQEISFATRIWG